MADKFKEMDNLSAVLTLTDAGATLTLRPVPGIGTAATVTAMGGQAFESTYHLIEGELNRIKSACQFQEHDYAIPRYFKFQADPEMLKKIDWKGVNCDNRKELIERFNEQMTPDAVKARAQGLHR